MATEERRNRVYKALHKPLLIFGIERKIFGGVVAVAYLMHYATRSFLAAVCTFVLGAIIGYIVTKKDPIYFSGSHAIVQVQDRLRRGQTRNAESGDSLEC